MPKIKLEKLKITAYTVNRNQGNIQLSDGTPLEVRFNPESYSLKYENKYNKPQGINTSSKPQKYTLSKPQELSLKLIFDSTSKSLAENLNLKSFATSIVPVIPQAISLFQDTEGVYPEVEKFLQLTTFVDGESHEPKFLLVEWGDLQFKCRLASVEVKYTLFARTGKPLRAELDVIFIQDIPDDVRNRLDNLNSPDLTHIRQVKNGDTLPLMAQEIYNDSSYYIQLARANNLDNFRKLKAGTPIKLPPIKK